MNLSIPDLTPSDLSRFWSKIEIINNCWNWKGFKNRQGYGRFRISSVDYLSHRISYFIKNEDLDPNLTIDHLCKNTSCVNPDHLEEVTQKENISRGNTGKHQNHHNKFKTQCPNGHPYDVVDKEGTRRCSLCLKKKHTPNVQ